MLGSDGETNQDFSREKFVFLRYTGSTGINTPWPTARAETLGA